MLGLKLNHVSKKGSRCYGIYTLHILIHSASPLVRDAKIIQVIYMTLISVNQRGNVPLKSPNTLTWNNLLKCNFRITQFMMTETQALLVYAVHYDDVIMSAIASRITSLTTVYLIVYSRTDQIKHYSIRVPGWVLKCLNLITAPGSVSNQPGSVTWLATTGISKIHAVSWRNHIENQTTKGAQNM